MVLTVLQKFYDKSRQDIKWSISSDAFILGCHYTIGMCSSNGVIINHILSLSFSRSTDINFNLPYRSLVFAAFRIRISVDS